MDTETREVLQALLKKVNDLEARERAHQAAIDVFIARLLSKFPPDEVTQWFDTDTDFTIAQMNPPEPGTDPAAESYTKTFERIRYRVGCYREIDNPQL